jgi:hypothetical protein
MWLMDGSQVIGGGQVASVDPAWQVVYAQAELAQVKRSRGETAGTPTAMRRRLREFLDGW